MSTYLFIDESGDPGDISPDNSNSIYYAELALQVTSNNIFRFREHLTNWRYIKSIFKEVKNLPKGKELSVFLKPLILLQKEGLISCSCIYLDKTTYMGPYLKKHLQMVSIQSNSGIIFIVNCLNSILKTFPRKTTT